jgi:hypothetical protein
MHSTLTAKTPTTEMEVTSIRLERELKERLKAIAGTRGYQSLVRDVLWNYVRQQDGDARPQVELEQIRATFAAIAQQDTHCALTGKGLRSGEAIVMALTVEGTLLPLDRSVLDVLAAR